MKKLFLTVFFITISGFAFSQDNLPVFIVEVNTGYAVGVNVDSSM